MTQLIDLIEEIRKFNFDHHDYRGYFSSMKSYRQIDDMTIEAVGDFTHKITDFKIKTNLGEIKIDNFYVNYDRIFTIRFLSVDPINKTTEYTIDSYVSRSSVSITEIECEDRYRDEVKRQVLRRIEHGFGLLDSRWREPETSKIEVILLDPEFVESSESIKELDIVKKRSDSILHALNRHSFKLCLSIC